VTTEGARELLLATHTFPCAYVVKAIGLAGEDFVGRIRVAAESAIARPAAVKHTVRFTPDGQHAAVTLDVDVASADEVMAIYRALQPIKGLKFLL
jgi:putative lipoic acid-binding regulatory protein